MNAYSFDLQIIINRANTSIVSIKLKSYMVDCLSYFMECLSSYFLLDLHLQKSFSSINNLTRPNECIWF